MKSSHCREIFDTRSSEWIGDMTVWLQENSPDNSEQRERLLRNLRKAIKEELTPRQRQFVEMYYFQRKNTPTIAEELGINVSTVVRSLKRSRKKIRKCLEYSF